MFVYRGEKLTDASYVKEKRKEDYLLAEEEIKYLKQKLEQAKLEEEKIIASKSEILKQYEMYTKPISELTKSEKATLLNQISKFGLGDKNLDNVDDKELESLRQILNIFIEDPLSKVKSDVEYYENQIKETKEIYSKYFVIALNRDHITRENIDNITKRIHACKEKGLHVMVGIDYDMSSKKNDSNVDYIYSKEEMRLLLELDNTLKNNGYDGIVFSEMNEISRIRDFKGKWGLEQVVNANKRIDDYAKYILDNNLSPFEAMIYIHKMASKFVYKYGGIFEQGRVLPSVINDANIVCAGYASFVKAIVDKINLPGLKCDIKGCTIGKGREFQGHCHNVVHIEDSKYDISGVYVEDSCWDSRPKNERKGKGLGHCLYPVNDVMNFSGNIRYFDSDSDMRLSNLIYDPKDYVDVLRELYGGPLERLKVKISKILKRKAHCKLVETYGDNSSPIEIEKYREALSNVFRTKYDNEEEIERMVNEDIENSVSSVVNNFNLNASNTFILEAKKKQRKEKSKNARGPSARM